MPRFMLDTDTCSYIMKRSHPLVLKRLQAVQVSDICMSVITKAELLHGVEVSPRRAHDATALAAFLRYVEVIDFSDEAVHHYGEIRADLQERGAMIGHRSLHGRPRTQSRAQVGHEQHGRVRPRERADGRELDASPSFSFDNRRVAGCRRPSLA
jgi:tRNA(fMet)-specific endonuclease VapC